MIIPTVAKDTALTVLVFAVGLVTVAMIHMSKFATSIETFESIKLSITTARVLAEKLIVFVSALNCARDMSNALYVLTLFRGFW